MPVNLVENEARVSVFELVINPKDKHEPKFFDLSEVPEEKWIQIRSVLDNESTSLKTKTTAAACLYLVNKIDKQEFVGLYKQVKGRIENINRKATPFQSQAHADEFTGLIFNSLILFPERLNELLGTHVDRGVVFDGLKRFVNSPDSSLQGKIAILFLTAYSNFLGSNYKNDLLIELKKARHLSVLPSVALRLNSPDDDSWKEAMPNIKNLIFRRTLYQSLDNTGSHLMEFVLGFADEINFSKTKGLRIENKQINENSEKPIPERRKY